MNTIENRQIYKYYIYIVAERPARPLGLTLPAQASSGVGGSTADSLATAEGCLQDS